MKYSFFMIFFFLVQFKIELNDNISIISNPKRILEKEQKSEFINLSDKNFNSYVCNGKYNRWFIIFYSPGCYYCDRALQVMEKILYKNNYKIVNNIKFGKIDILENDKISFRFNISQIPNIIIIENNSMIELDLYPNEENLLYFIKSNFSDALNILPIPKINYLKYYYLSLENSFSILVGKINNILISFNINYNINFIKFILLYLIFLIIFWIIVIKGFTKCCRTNKKVNLNNKNNMNNTSENNEIEKEDIDNNKEEKNNNSRKKYFSRNKKKAKKK